MGTEEFLRVKEAAEILGVSSNTVRTWASTGKLQEYRHPINNYRLFKKHELELLVYRIANPTPIKRRRIRAK